MRYSSQKSKWLQDFEKNIHKDVNNYLVLEKIHFQQFSLFQKTALHCRALVNRLLDLLDVIGNKICISIGGLRNVLVRKTIIVDILPTLKYPVIKNNQFWLSRPTGWIGRYWKFRKNSFNISYSTPIFYKLTYYY